MKFFFYVLHICMFVGIGFAQDRLPELAAVADKYRAAAESLEKARMAAAAQAAEPYLDALNGIEKSATAKGEVKTVEAAARERKAALAGALVPELPAELPALRLRGMRNALLTRQEKINADADARRKHLNSQYLAVLAALDEKASPESALAKQIVAERDAMLAGEKTTEGGKGTADGANAKIPRGKNAVVNGDFEKPELGDAWWSNSVATIVAEHGSRFVQFKAAETNSAGVADIQMIRQKIVCPPDAQKVLISVRVRLSGRIVRLSGGCKPLVQLSFQAERKKFFAIACSCDVKSGVWKTVKGEVLIPPGMKETEISLENGYCPGPVDFDDLEVTFR